jgi:hypothetical protein
MAIIFDEHNLFRHNWDMIWMVLNDAAALRDGKAFVGPQAAGRWAEGFIESAEYFEAAARFLRRTEAMLVESKR